jgi:sucrose phosphorylase
MEDIILAIKERLRTIYPKQVEQVYPEILSLIERWKSRIHVSHRPIDQHDVCLITYGDSIRKTDEMPLSTLNRFYKTFLSDTISIIHILPFYPYTSDDGFSVVDFRTIDPKLGDWHDIDELKKHVDLMFDAVINHVSKDSLYFIKYLNQENGYETFFTEIDPKVDLSSVTRPRTSPVLTPFMTKNGVKHVWTTFSDDQVDLNYQDPRVLIEVLDVLLFYVFKGARMIRFDAVGFIWKKLNTTCMHLEETHALVKLMREVLDSVVDGVKIITETNVKHDENISYSGNGHDDASPVYPFPLPPLVVQAYISEKTTYLMHWLNHLEKTSKDTLFFNFLSSHDGIGLRPLEGIIPDHEKTIMLDTLLSRGAKINYRNLSNGQKTPYECCITFTDALSNLEDSDPIRAMRLLGAHMILLSLQGLPAIYIHSMLGSRNDLLGYQQSLINRRINREKLNFDHVIQELTHPHHLRYMVFEGLKKMIDIRKQEPLFHPHIEQQPYPVSDHVFGLLRGDNHSHIITLVNVSKKTIQIPLPGTYMNLLTQQVCHDFIDLEPFAYGWFKLHKTGM